MKSKFLLLLLLASSFFPSKAGPINYRNKHLAPIAFNITISPQLMDQLNNLEHEFPDYQNPKASKIIKRLKEVTWTYLEERLEGEIGLYLSPLNSYGKKFDYDEYDFPNTSINKAIRKGNSKYYIKIDLSIAFETIPTNTGFMTGQRPRKDTSQVATGAPEDEPKPHVIFNVTTYSEKGIIPLDKFLGQAKGGEPWIIDANFLNGLVNSNFDESPNTLMGLINQAISNLILNMTK